MTALEMLMNTGNVVLGMDNRQPVYVEYLNEEPACPQCRASTSRYCQMHILTRARRLTLMRVEAYEPVNPAGVRSQSL